jgi:hypothetical protein
MINKIKCELKDKTRNSPQLNQNYQQLKHKEINKVTQT